MQGECGSIQGSCIHSRSEMVDDGHDDIPQTKTLPSESKAWNDLGLGFIDGTMRA